MSSSEVLKNDGHQVEVDELVDQIERFLHLKEHWFQAIENNETKKITAFCDKACVLFGSVLSVVGNKKVPREPLTEETAAVMCQSIFRMQHARRAFKLALKRKRVALEINQSERVYMRGIGLACSLFQQECKGHISQKEDEVIFSNLHSLRTKNIPFWGKLEKRLRDWNIETKISDVFLGHLDVIVEEYVNYVRGYDKAIVLHQELLENNKEYAKIMDRTRNLPEASGMGLDAYLILAVQRMPRYKLLLGDLMKRTPEDHGDYAGLEKARDMVGSMTMRINEETRKTQNYQKLLELEEKFDQKVQLTSVPTRILLDEIEVKVKEPGDDKFKPRSLLMFNDMIVCVLVKKGKKDDEVTWHFEWKINGVDSHVKQDFELGPMVFIMIEYRKVDSFPYTQTVEHIIEPLDLRRYAFFYWRDKVANFKASLEQKEASGKDMWMRESDWSVLTEAGTEKDLKKDEVLCEANKPVKYCYVVLDGNMKNLDRKGMGVDLGTVRKDDLVGVECALDVEGENPCRVVCSSYCKVAAIPMQNLFTILGVDPNLSYRFFMLSCVTIAKEFHQWKLPKSIERHYLSLSIDDANPQKTLNTILSATGEKVDDEEESSDASVEDKHAKNDKLKSLGKMSSSVKGLEKDQPNTARKVTHKVNKIDAKMCSILGVNPPETPSKKYDASMKRGDKRNRYKGGLFLYTHVIGFHCKILGRTIKSSIFYSSIQDLKIENENIVISYGKKEKASFELDEKEREPCFNMMISFLRRNMERSLGSDNAPSTNLLDKLDNEEVEDKLKLTEKQWEAVFEICDRVQYKKDEMVLEEGKREQKIFQITSGSCRVELPVEETIDGKVVKTSRVVAHMKEGALFGEKSYLFGDLTSASIVADEDGTECYILNRIKLEKLFSEQPTLGGPFYRQMALSISTRYEGRNKSVLAKYEELLKKKGVLK